MKFLRKSADRGSANFGWLQALHSFSFGNYYDPRYMGFSALRVINEDRVAAARGFPTHGHQDMEIITFILSGALEHKDSMGNGSIITPGQIQYMSAGTGVDHSEYNPSTTEQTHLLQIWIEPHTKGLTPRYGQKDFTRENITNSLYLLCSEQGENGSIPIRQDAKLFVGKFLAGHTQIVPTKNNRGTWIQVLSGNLEVAEERLSPGDGLAIEQVDQILLSASTPCEFLLFDLP